MIKKLLLTLLILASGILAYTTLTRGHTWGGDFAAYIMQAKSVAERNIDQYIEVSRFIFDKSEDKMGPVAYPWGLPVLLAPLYSLFGLNMLVLKSINVVCYLLFLVSIVFFFYKRHSYLFIFVFVLFFAIHPVILYYVNELMSDIPFLFFSTVSVLLMGRIVTDQRALLSNITDYFLLGILMSACFFIRTNGILIFPTLAITHGIRIAQWVVQNRNSNNQTLSPVPGSVSRLMRFNWKTVSINLIPYFTFISLTLIWRSFFQHGGTTHISSVPELSRGLIEGNYEYYETIRYNVHYYFELIAEFYYKMPHASVLYGATLPLLIVGIIENIKRDYCLLVYACLTVLMLIFWPGAAGLRFYFPILPFYIHFVFAGLQWSLKSFKGCHALAVQALILCAILMISGYFVKYSARKAYYNIRSHRLYADGPFGKSSQDMFTYVREHIEKDNAVIVFFKPRVMTLLTDRLSIYADSLTELNKGSHLCIYLDEYGLKSQLPLNTVEELVKDRQLTLIYANQDFKLYKIMNPILFGGNKSGRTPAHI